MKTSERARLFARCVVPVLVSGAGVNAQINITNPSFEEPSLNPGGYTTTGIPGWTVVSGGGDWGIFYPTVASWGYVAPHGNQLAYTNGPLIENTSPAVLTAGITYTLCVSVVHRPGFWNPNYIVQLVVGSTVVDEDLGSLVPPVGGSLTVALSYTAQPNDPLLGQPVRIRLGGPSQCNFDDVMLDDGTGCYADCDSSCALNIFDYICFGNAYASNDPYADCDGSGSLNIFDYICFGSAYAGGCP